MRVVPSHAATTGDDDSSKVGTPSNLIKDRSEVM